MSNLRPGFLKIIDGWNSKHKLTDIPNRLKRVEDWIKSVGGDLTANEQEIVDFMKDTQQTREFVRAKPKDDDDE